MINTANMLKAKMEAHHLHEEIVSAYALLTANADMRRVSFRMEDVEASFLTLAGALGFKVERVESEVA